METLDIFTSGVLPSKYRPLIASSAQTGGYHVNLNTGFVEGRAVSQTDGTITLGERYFIGSASAGSEYVFKWTLTYAV